MKPKYDEKAKLCYMDTDSFIVNEKKQMIFAKILQEMLKLDFKLWIRQNELAISKRKK